MTYLPAATSTEVADILKNTADKVGPFSYSGGRNDWFGAGRLNVARAVRWAYPPSLKPIAQPAGFLLGGAMSQASVTLPLTSDSDRPLTWQATVLQGASWLQALPANGAVSYSAPGALTLKADSSSLSPGSYEGVVEVRTVSPSSASQVFFVTPASSRYHPPAVPAPDHQSTSGDGLGGPGDRRHAHLPHR